MFFPKDSVSPLFAPAKIFNLEIKFFPEEVCTSEIEGRVNNKVLP